MRSTVRTTIFILILLTFGITAFAANFADTVYRDGYVYTVDAKNSVRQAVAIKDGTIIYVGSNSGVKRFIDQKTKVIDLQGRMMMPGLVDGHMHPLEGGEQLLKCSLNYEALTVQQFQQRIQACLEKTSDKEPDGWLEVVNWFQQNMIPPGTNVSHEDLDGLKTKRPILVRSSFGHSTLANARAMELAHITPQTPNPSAGSITHDANGNPTGIFEDEAQDLFTPLLPKATDEDRLAAAAASLDAMRKQGITTFLDAAAPVEGIIAFSKLQKDGKLTARGHFAPVISPDEGKDADKAVANVVAIRRQYDQGAMGGNPTIRVHNAKLFMDGVITAPAFTGVMLTPYLTNQGTPEKPHWVADGNKGPAPYFPADVLKPLLLKLAEAGIEPHIHADGDAATRYALDGFAAMRAKFSGKQIRAAIAHDEIVDPADFPRYKTLDVIPVLSFQWAKPASDTVEGAKDYLGPARYKYMEPEGFLYKAGARIAYGSDWPVDPLNEWFALKVGITRTNDPKNAPQYKGRLSEDPGLSRATVIRAITMNASYELHQEQQTGSIEAGKFADLIVLDRNFFKIPAEDIANIQVLMTIVGGKVVYQSAAEN
jgi:predicted amidohydrolase YtcJ